MNGKDYVAIVQCHLVKQRCSGYFCEKAFTERSGGFSDFPADATIRKINLTCGGCCGLALHRKLSNLLQKLKKCEDVSKDRVLVQFSSCITKDNYHGPPCPHLDYLKVLVDKLGLDYQEDTTISKTAEKRRAAGEYKCNPSCSDACPPS